MEAFVHGVSTRKVDDLVGAPGIDAGVSKSRICTESRGLTGVRLVISDAHEGLRTSIERVMIGAAWQRCRVHFLRIN